MGAPFSVYTDLCYYLLGISWSLVLTDEGSQGQQTLSDLGTKENNTVAFNIYRDVRAVPEERTIRS
jgi:hypothetical protein